MKITISDQTCHLLAEKAVYWEEKKTLIVADIHVGKDTAFRKAGIPIPEGILDDDLLNLKNLIIRFAVEKCLIVGDLIHAATGLSDNVKKIFSDWLQNLSCEVHLVIGNHDAALLKDLPTHWPLMIHENGYLMEPFYFSHYPVRQKKMVCLVGALASCRRNKKYLRSARFKVFSDFSRFRNTSCL